MERVVLNKIESIERCIKRIKETVERADFDLNNFDFQDIIILNLQRACQQSIDLAMYIVSNKKLGLPSNSRDAFIILKDSKIISDEISLTLTRMVGFRNIIIHEYQQIELKVIEYILENGLDDFLNYSKSILYYYNPNN